MGDVERRDVGGDYDTCPELLEKQRVGERKDQDPQASNAFAVVSEFFKLSSILTKTKFWE